MGKAPREPQEIFQEITKDYQGLFNEDLISIILYGSAAGAEYRPGTSDINFMIVLSEEGIGRLDRAFGTVSKWRKRRVSVPLFITEHYIETSLDTFPVEYLNFQHNHVLIYGVDVLKDLTFKPEFLRLQCEREIKGKLLLLREAFLESSGKMSVLRDVISQSMRAFLALFRALLFLKGEDMARDRRHLLAATCRTFDLNQDLFQNLLDIAEERNKPRKEEMIGLFGHYLEEIRRLSKSVDTLGG
ncbi:MAG: hypothetical protein JRH06_09820 [Deltaproteobacteria bacterium]|nr:hypothetical protein [Deltaproteobacteria bacterium]MBW2137842.1 hypothetical protein [Deltaproteobacteria bacterium]